MPDEKGAMTLAEAIHIEFAEFVGQLVTPELKERMLAKLLALLEPPRIIINVVVEAPPPAI